MGTLEISLFGGFLLRRDGANLEPIPSRAGRSLLAFLVMNRERAHTRDLLAGLFWPDLPDARARRRLSQALWQVQARIGGEGEGERRLLLTQGDSLGFDPDADFWLDVNEFEWALEQSAPVALASRTEEADLLASAVRLYRGDLLEGFYDDWMIPDRERLRQRFLGALDRLADLTMARGEYEAALTHARRLVQHDPFREEAHCRVMRLAVLLGRHNDAIRQYEQCRRVLADELSTAPSEATRELYQATLADREAGHRTLVVSSESPLFATEGRVPFVGREHERSVLVRRLDAAIDGQGGLVLVEGESGVGKTRLLAEVVGDAGWRGMEVLWGRSSPSGGRPFAPLAEALTTGLSPLRARQLAQRLEPIWREQLAPLVPPLGADAATAPAEAALRPADEQARMRESITLAFVRLAEIAPILVVLEDVHWADDDTIQALAQLAGRTEGHRLVLAVSYRHAEARERLEVWDLLRSFDRRPYCERLSLSPCSPAQTEELMRRCLGLPEVSSDLSQRVHRDTGGVPLFIIETLRAFSEQRSLGETEEAPTSAERLALTPRLHTLIRSRLGGLPDGSRATLDLISVHDGELTLTEIVTATELDDAAVLHGVDHLNHRGLIAQRGGGYHIGHELLRRVVYAELALSRRLDLHRQVALAVERHRPDQVEVLAHHFSVACMPDRAADYLERAADRALSVHAYDTAALHLARANQALEQIDAPPQRRFRVAARQEEVLDTLGRRSEQEEALARMARFVSGPQVGDLHRRRAWWLAHQDRFPEAEAEAQQALDVARTAGDGGRAVAALSTLGMIACFAGQAADGVVHLEEAAAYRGADRHQQADARNALGQNLIDLQRFDEAESQLLASLALYGELHDARGQAEVLGMLGTLRMERGEPELAEADFRRAIDMSRSIGYRHGEAVCEMNLGILHALTNRLGDAVEAFERAAVIYEVMTNRRGRALVLSNAAWMRHAVLGDDERAETDAFEALGVYRQIGDVRGEAQCLGTLGSLACRRKNTDEGVRLFEESLQMARSANDSWIAAQILKEYARAQLAAGLVSASLESADEALLLCESAGMNDLRIGIKALRGRLLLAAGRVGEAVAATSEAVAELRPGIELAHLVPFAHGQALAAAGRREEADRYLETAYEQLQALLADLPPAQREAAIAAVPTHREVAEAWARRQPRRVEYRIARAGAPTGRPLTSAEWVTITWTVGTPDDEAVADQAERRRRRLLRLLGEAAAQGGAPTINDLADALDAGAVTIRRDLAALRAAGYLVATRGSRTTR